MTFCVTVLDGANHELNAFRKKDFINQNLIERKKLKFEAILKKNFIRGNQNQRKSERKKKRTFKYSNHCLLGRGRDKSIFLVGFRFLGQLPVLRFPFWPNSHSEIVLKTAFRS